MNTSQVIFDRRPVNQTRQVVQRGTTTSLVGPEPQDFLTDPPTAVGNP
jgi:hypothetical protein